VNSALPALTCAEAVDAIKDGEVVEVDLAAGEIRCEAGVFRFPRLPEQVIRILDAGGLIPYTKDKLAGSLRRP
jgi:3-isopropylmalate/(R)-2-methylmalate dehydratase small subunit